MEVDSREIRERNDQVKRWLWRYREAKKDVRRYENELHELIETQESTGAIEYSDMPKGSGSQSDLSDYMVKRDEAWKRIMKARYKRIVVFQEIKNVIEQLPSADEREIMSCRYIQLNGYKAKSWEEVCVITNHEWAQAHRIHAKALKNIRLMQK